MYTPRWWTSPRASRSAPRPSSRTPCAAPRADRARPSWGACSVLCACCCHCVISAAWHDTHTVVGQILHQTNKPTKQTNQPTTAGSATRWRCSCRRSPWACSALRPTPLRWTWRSCRRRRSVFLSAYCLARRCVLLDCLTPWSPRRLTQQNTPPHTGALRGLCGHLPGAVLPRLHVTLHPQLAHHLRCAFLRFGACTYMPNDT